MRDLVPGTVLDGRFVVRQRLGSGAFGTVYLADQQVFDLKLRQVALKLFHSGLVTEESAREQLNDAVVLMRLQEEEDHRAASRHLVTVLDAGFLNHDGVQAFVAMEFAAGYQLAGGGTARTLRHLIDKFRPVPVDLALRWMSQVLRAVGWMHTRDPAVLHCDLKTDNVLTDGPAELKVADFGLAQLAFGSVGLEGGAGALTCQAPETLMGGKPTPASDVYSLGLMLFEILSGRNPLADVGLAEMAADDGDGQRQQQVKARRAGLPLLTEADNPDLVDHPLVSEIVARCLRFNGSERYPNAAMLLKDIESYQAGGPVTVQGADIRIPGDTPELARLLDDAEALHGQGRTAEAYARAEAALHRFPKAVAPYLTLAKMHLTSDRWSKALELCATADGVAKPGLEDSVKLLEMTADAYDAGGQPKIAARMRERAAALRRKRPR